MLMIMNRIILLLLISMLLISCFTSKLLEDDTNVSAIAPKDYSFNRAYYTSDSILHLDFNNLNSKTEKTSYFSTSFDINTILKEYDRIKENKNANFKGRFSRKFNILSGASLVLDSTCNVNNYYPEATLLSFDEIKVSYLSKLNPVPDSSLIMYTDVIADNCIMKPRYSNCNYYSPVAAINTPWYVYVIPTLSSSNRYVALRMPLRTNETKMKYLPFTLIMDIVTSPIQFGFYCITNNSGKVLNGDKPNRVDNSKPPPVRHK